MEFSKRLQIVTDRLNWTQDELANKCGISSGTISRWKQSPGIPSKNSLNKICRATSCTLRWLKDGEKPIFSEDSGDGNAGNKTTTLSEIEIKQARSAEHSSHSTSDLAAENSYPIDQFNNLCFANLQFVVQYIAENYGTSAADIERFKRDLLEQVPDIRLWLYSDNHKNRD